MCLVIVVLSIALAVSDLLVKRKTQKDSRQIVVASAAFDKFGRVLVKLNGSLPFQVIETEVVVKVSSSTSTFLLVVSLFRSFRPLFPFPPSRLPLRTCSTNSTPVDQPSNGSSASPSTGPSSQPSSLSSLNPSSTDAPTPNPPPNSLPLPPLPTPPHQQPNPSTVETELVQQQRKLRPNSRTACELSKPGSSKRRTSSLRNSRSRWRMWESFSIRRF